MPQAVVCAFFLLLFGEVVFGGRFALIGDPLKQFYPIRTVAWEMIREGSFPLWFPHLLSGYPMGSMAMVGFGYPLTWGYLVLPGQWAEQLYVMAPYLLAPLFTYAFLREWQRSREASLLGGLAFGYGGFLFSPIGLTGVHANSALWMPLVLLGVARARRRPLLESLMIATGAYTMAVLAGSGQIFLFSGALAIGYALFLMAFPGGNEEGEPRRRWQPLVAAVGAIVLAVGLTSFQTFETWTAVRQSVREAYPAERVEEGSFPPGLAVRSLLQPLGNYWDSSTYVPLLAVLLAFAAFMGRGRRTPQVYFWSFVAVLAWLLVMGKHTPLFDLYVRLPFVTLFRYPSRHSLEWSFAIAVLASYGWDSAEEKLRAIRSGRGTARHGTTVKLLGAGALVLLAAAFGTLWQRQTVRARLDQVADINLSLLGLDAGYVKWKVLFTLCLLAAIGLLWTLDRSKLRLAFLSLVAAFACFVEPYLWVVRPVIVPYSVSGELFGTFAETTAVVRQNLAPGERVFSATHPYAVSSEPVRIADAANWTALARLEEANGYESLILSRYSRAFAGYVDTEPFVSPDRSLLGARSRVLDLLSVGCVVAYSDFAAVPNHWRDHEGIRYSLDDFAADITVDNPFILEAAEWEADSVALVTTLGQAGRIEQGFPVARVSIHAAGGRVIERELLAGVHTSELAYDRPDVSSLLPHERAPIFDSWPGDENGSFQNHRFVARIEFGERLRVSRVEIIKTTPDAGVGLWKVSLHDSSTGLSAPLPLPSPERWRTLYERDGAIVLRNLKALPRAWLVKDVEMLEGSEILRLIRGESQSSFDPRFTAFIEREAGAATTGAFEAFRRESPSAGKGADGEVRIGRRGPNRLVFETDAAEPALLVTGELDYPGWAARLDGAPVSIHTVNYLFRGVFVPAGRHTIEMTYDAPGMRKGAVVSLLTLLSLIIAWKSPLRKF